MSEHDDLGTPLAEVLHNVDEHVETYHRLLGGEVPDAEFRGRLERHILLEEQENSEKLRQLHEKNPSNLARKLMDHSYFLQGMIERDDMPLDLKQELLHHFLEEHREWRAELSGSGGAAWTVGPMWGQGGR